jgi:hypothetical protein
VEVVTFGTILGHFSPIVPPSAAGFASVASDAWGLSLRKLERSKLLVLLQVGGLTCRWQRHSVKAFLLRMLNDSWAGRNPTKGCSADWRRRRITNKTKTSRAFIKANVQIYYRTLHHENKIRIQPPCSPPQKKIMLLWLYTTELTGPSGAIRGTPVEKHSC